MATFQPELKLKFELGSISVLKMFMTTTIFALNKNLKKKSHKMTRETISYGPNAMIIS